MSDRLGPSAIDAGFDGPMCALGAVVHVERADEILLRHIAADLDADLRRIT